MIANGKHQNRKKYTDIRRDFFFHNAYEPGVCVTILENHGNDLSK